LIIADAVSFLMGEYTLGEFYVGAVTTDMKELFGLNCYDCLLLGATKLGFSVLEYTSTIESAISTTFLVCFSPRVPFALILVFVCIPAFYSMNIVTYEYIFFSRSSNSRDVLALPASNARLVSLVASR